MHSRKLQQLFKNEFGATVEDFMEPENLNKEEEKDSSVEIKKDILGPD